MKKLTQRALGLILALTMTLSLSVPAFAKNVEFSEQAGLNYQLVRTEETQYGTIYYVREYSPYGETGGNAAVLAIAPWDIIDILMAGVSWANLLAEPSWSNFAWAVLDTAALLPYLPNHVVIKNVAGKITGIKPDELAKFAKTVEGKNELPTVCEYFPMLMGLQAVLKNKF